MILLFDFFVGGETRTLNFSIAGQCGVNHYTMRHPFNTPS